jgi:hypothetical protein
MLETLVFQKTDLARQELGSRRLGLSNTLRLVLVLVDGRRDVRTLTAFSDTVARNPECLLELFNSGLIEVVGETDELDERQPGMLRALREGNDLQMERVLADSMPKQTSYIVEERKAFAAPGFPAEQQSAQAFANLVLAKQALVAELHRVLKEESATACLRVQQAESIEDMLVLLPKLTDLVGLYTTTSKGAALHDQVRDLLLQ